MSNEADKFWDDYSKDLRRKKGYCPLTPEEAQTELDSLPDRPLTRDELEEIDEVVDSVTSGEARAWTPTPEFGAFEDVDTESIAEDVLQLNKNAGEGDEQTDELLRKLRREALTEDENGEADENGLDGAENS
jgi:hypothetical protein